MKTASARHVAKFCLQFFARDENWIAWDLFSAYKPIWKILSVKLWWFTLFACPYFQCRIELTGEEHVIAVVSSWDWFGGWFDAGIATTSLAMSRKREGVCQLFWGGGGEGRGMFERSLIYEAEQWPNYSLAFTSHRLFLDFSVVLHHVL